MQILYNKNKFNLKMIVIVIVIQSKNKMANLLKKIE